MGNDAMRNQNVKTWMWQRLFKFGGYEKVMVYLSHFEDDPYINQERPSFSDEDKPYWLCPKPCLVLV